MYTEWQTDTVKPLVAAGAQLFACLLGNKGTRFLSIFSVQDLQNPLQGSSENL